MLVRLLQIILFIGTLTSIAQPTDKTTASPNGDTKNTIGSSYNFKGETGLSFLRNYLPGEYASVTPFVDNWHVLQDQSGAILIGNTGGILRYNGNTWQYIETPTKSMVRSLAMDQAGRVYVGASDELGYLSRDKSGKIEFISLLEQIPDSSRKFGDIRQTVVTPEGVFFLSATHLFRWSNNQMDEWKAETSFSYIGWLHKQLYVQQAEKGLYTLSEKQLKLVSDQAPFTQSGIVAMLPLGKEQVLVATRSLGLYQMQEGVCTPFNSRANPFLVSQSLHCGIQLPDGNFAFGTLQGGLLIMNPQGGIVRIINKESGLKSNSIHYLFVDKQEGLWMATSNGATRMEVFSPFSVYGESNGLVGNIQELRRYNGNLYASTSAGLYILNRKDTTGKPPFFQPVPGLSEFILRLFPFEDQLLISGTKNLYQLHNNKISILQSNLDVTGLHRSLQDPSLVFLASDGIYAIRWTGDDWKMEGRIPEIYEDIHTITENKAGELFLATRWQGTIKLTFSQKADGKLSTDQLKHPIIEHIGVAQGMPPGVNRLYWVGEKLLLRIGEDPFELFKYDNRAKKFLPASHLNKELGLANVRIYPALDTLSAHWWWTKGQEDKQWNLTHILEKPDGTLSYRQINLNRIPEYLGKSVILEGDSIIWFRGKEGMMRYELNNSFHRKHPFNTLLERITLSKDSAIYPHKTLTASSLPFSNNSLRFEFAAPSFDNAQENEFQYQLQGYDDHWSAWTKESYKEYTRIPEGKYVFLVRSRNLNGDLGEAATYSLQILPPWYRTMPVYGLYLLLVGSAFYGVLRWRSAKLIAEKIKLEEIISQRTQEIASKNVQLSEQAEELARQAEKLKEMDGLKSRFFANISHEFRTPLTLILNTLSDKLSLKDKRSTKSQVVIARTEMKVMHRNANRLLQLINQLLDLSKIESGKMKLELANGDLKQLIRVIFASFSSLATIKSIDFELILPKTSLLCQFDPDKIEKILNNLLSNAFKFTPQGGKISLIVDLKDSSDRLLVISVQDSGPGMGPEQAARVFERFYQGDQYYADEQGTGIGLALCKELVELHQGCITVNSESGRGTCFIVQLPFIAPSAANSAVLLHTGLPDLTYTRDESDEHSSDSSLEKDIVDTQVFADGEDVPLVLIVEDNEDLRAYIRSHLSSHYRIIESENGLKGLETALETIPDLIVSDWMMPGLDGLELCRRMKTDERLSHIPFILLTALATSESKITGLEVGADDYLTKPFDSQELISRIDNLITTRRKLRDYYSRELRLYPSEVEVASEDEKFLQRLLKIIEEKMGEFDFSVEELSHEVGMSRVQLHRKLKALTGHSPSDFIRVMRLKRAAQLMEARSGNITEIAYQVGFNSLSYFSKCFHDFFGVLPTEYANRYTISKS